MVLKEIQWTEYGPSAPVTEDDPIEFVVSGAGKHYADLQNTKLYIKAKRVKPDGSNL